ncbi:MAG: hypothetical protein K8R68_11525 [Bacteroidales bacterium]|nr:hypothetical protein [Bacteroidales bacterium]
MRPSFKLMNIVLIACLCVLFSSNLYSQTQVIINIQQPPFNQLNMEDLWKISLNNTTNEALSVYLFGTLSEESAGLIATGTTSEFNLNPGMKIVSAHELSPISINYPNPDMRYKESMIRKGGVPSGNYEVCISVKISGSNEEVGSDCIEQSVQISSPVSLVTPDYGEKLFLQLPVFTWMHMKQPGSGAYYTLTIVEILSSQTPEIAIQTNLAWFTKDKINKTLLQYPISARGFENGKEYAWKIDVYEEGSLLTESDVGLFRYNYAESRKPDIIFPKVGEEIEIDGINFEWFYNIQGDNIFSVKVVEMLDDQSPEAAMQENATFWEMNNIQETRIRYPGTGQNFIVGKQYAWQVSVFEGGTLLANSDAASFKISSIETPSVDIIFPKVGEEIEVDEVNFEWTYNAQADNTPSYSIKVVEVLDGQSPQYAMQENAAFWEMTGIQQTSIKYPETEKEFEANKKYAWQVSVFNGETLLANSDVQSFIIGSDKSSNLDIIFPKVGEEIEVDGLYFEWKKYYNPEIIILYSIKIVEVFETQTPESAMENNESYFEKNGLETPVYLYYLDSSTKLDNGKRYAWQIKAYNSEVLLAESKLGAFEVIASNE